jgi:uncharacterized repeat protein (TIGR03803 family)
MKNQAKQLLVVLALLAGIPLAGAQTTFIPLYSFTGGHDGALPQAGLMQASDGYLYGATKFGGISNNFSGYGAIFRITTNGVFTSLYSFTNGNDGAYPYGSLVQASDGNLYGTALRGGTNGAGTVFRITTNGVFMPLYSFIPAHDGANPESGLVQAGDGYLYGTADQGGTNSFGTVFRITTNGVLASLYSFTGGNDGADPFAGLVSAGDGYLYGTTLYGGISNGLTGYGTVFRITTNGVFTPFHSFTGGYDGANPQAGLTQAGDGNLYGTTEYGGISNNLSGYGTFFRILISGGPTPFLAPLYSFTNGNDGRYPLAGLVQAGDGNLYGTANEGGADGDGVVFRITANGVLTPLYSFTDGNDGRYPTAGLVQAGDGNLYGTAYEGGTNGDGTVFKIAFPPPALNVSSLGNQSVLFWPASAYNYVLQSATNLASPNWVTVSNAMPIIGVTVTNSSPAQYFRLANP